MSRGLAAFIAFVAAAALIAAGCGSDSSASTPLPKAVFVKKATAICEQTSAKVTSEGIGVLRELEKDGGKGDDPEAEFVAEWLVPKIQEEIDELRALGVPSGDEDRVDAILTAVQEVIDKAEEDPARYLSDQVNFKHPYKEAEKLASAYGIERCGQP